MKKVKFIAVLAVLIAIVYYGIIYLTTERDVKVIFISGAVYLDDAGKTALKVDDVVPPGISVKLGPDAVCFLQTPGGGVIKLSSRASARVKDKTAIHLEEGVLEYTSSGKLKEHPEITTLHAEMKLESGHCLLAVEDKESSVSVYEGKVSANFQGEIVSVEANKGAVLAEKAEPVVAQLPHPPLIKSPRKGARFEEATVPVVSDPVTDAVLYRWEYAQNPAFTRVILEQESRDGSARLRRPQEDGTYYLRGRAVNAYGLVSAPSEATSFEYGLHKKLKHYIATTRNFYINKKREDQENAVAWARQGLTLCPDHVELQKYLALSLIKLELRKEAGEVMRELEKSEWPEAQEALEEIQGELEKGR